MKCARYLLAPCLLAISMQAKAGWVDDQITTIMNNVQAVYDEVTGDVKDTAQDLKRQLVQFQQQGEMVRESVDDMLELLQHRQGPFQDFVNGGAGRCGAGSPCGNFRNDLKSFVLDMAALRQWFPQIEKSGLGSGQHLVDIIDHTPPLALFGPYELLQRVPGWQDIPTQLGYLYDEIGDADAFSFEVLGPSQAVAKSGTTGAFDAPQNGTDAFCSKGKQAKWDTVRLNRVKATLMVVKEMSDGLSDSAPETYDLTLFGEGASIPLPVKAIMKVTPAVIASIFDAVDAHRANLDVCKQIEADVAGGSSLVQYRTRDGVAHAYWVVKGILDYRTQKGILETKALSYFHDAQALAYRGLWKNAFDQLHNAYANL
ncbi:MAG: hypothetical protein ACM3QY_14395 [Candidatus Levyibacteriota bacterium]